MSNARKLADNLPREGSTANRRLTINGAMEVFQRAVAGSVTATTFHGPDQCRIILGGAGGYTITQASDAPTGFQKSLHLNTTSTSSYSSSSNINHLRFSSVEDQNCIQFNYGTSSAKQLTLQFWVKCTYTDTFTVALVNHAAQRSNFQRFTIDSANTWQKVELTFVGDTGGSGFDNDNTLGLSVDVFLAGGSSYRGGSNPVNTWDTRDNNKPSYVTTSTNFGSSTAHNIYFTGVQLEVGNVATPFEYRSFGDELAKCQRYYSQINGPVQGYPMWSYSNICSTHFYLPQEMRTIPSVTFTGTTNQGNSNSVTDNTFSIYNHNQWIGASLANGFSYGGTHASNTQSIRINCYPHGSFTSGGISAGFYMGSNCSINASAEI